MTALRSTGSARRRARAAGPPAPCRPRFLRAAQPLPPPPAPPTAEPLEPRRLLATFVVTTTADAGPGSLRQAILDANAAPGADEIHFAIPGAPGAVHTIRPLSPLPDVTGPTTLDGTTQSGYAGSPQIELDGSSAGDDVDGLTLFEGATTVRGLAVNGFGGNGIVTRPGAEVSNTAWVRIEANYVGTDATGTSARPNGAAGVLALAPRTSLGFGNVISGNLGAGVVVRLPPATTVIVGMNVADSRIGTDRTGTRALPNGREGVFIDGSAVGPGARARVWVNRNVISGNAFSGVRVDGPGGVGIPSPVFLAQNKIGTDVTGSTALGNGWAPAAEFRDGVTITGGVNVAIGPSNVISGNAGNGIAVLDGGAAVQGNTIGVDAAGTRAVANGGHGVLVVRNTVRTVVDGNLVSGNGGDGVRLASAYQADVLANRIGANGTFTAAIPNAGNGVTVEASRSVRVGATVPSPTPWPPAPAQPYNRVVGNAGHGIAVYGDPEDDTPVPRYPPSNVIVRGNQIGFVEVSAFGVSPRTAVIPNGGSGVYVAGTNGVTVGPDADDPVTNVIAHNVGDGVTVAALNGVPAAGTRVVGNAIFNNGRLGIDLRPPDGVTPNDPGDGDAGPNDLQNFPLVTAVTRNGDVVTVTLRLQSRPGQAYRLELFANTSPDRSGYGEGERLIGATNVTTSASGLAGATVTVQAASLPVSQWLTATATDSGGSTSEFSPAVHSLRGRPFYRPQEAFLPSTRQSAQPPAAAERATVLYRPEIPATALTDESRPRLG